MGIPTGRGCAFNKNPSTAVAYWPYKRLHALVQFVIAKSERVKDEGLPIDLDLLMRAYANGIFPMSDARDDPDIFWIEPERRAIFPLDNLKVSKSLAKTIVFAGYRVIVDAAFLKRADRQAFAALTDELGIPFVIVCCCAPTNILRDRVSHRASTGLDASDADVCVLERQLQTTEALDSSESLSTVEIDTTRDDRTTAAQTITGLIRDHRTG